jgi:DNA-binding SARP family transcriptional activator
MSHLSLIMFGSFQARIDDHPLIGFDCNKTRALLAYLADEPGKPQWRSMLAGLLWPERNENAALNNLRHALSCLGHLLKNSETTPPFLLIDRETITLNLASSCEIDTFAFQNLLCEHPKSSYSGIANLECWEKAILLFRGNFLENLRVDDSPDFEGWVMTRREFYNSLVQETLFTLSETYLNLSLYKNAETYARLQINLAPWKEEAYQQIIKALAYQGKRSEALKQFLICKEQLSKELGVEPCEESRRLFQLIKNERLSLHTPISS